METKIDLERRQRLRRDLRDVKSLMAGISPKLQKYKELEDQAKAIIKELENNYTNGN